MKLKASLWILGLGVLLSVTALSRQASAQLPLPGIWTSFATPNPPRIDVIALDPLFRDVLAGTNAGVFRSNDFGLTWFPAPPPISGRDIQSMIWVGNDTVYAGTWRSGVFYSYNGGFTWQAANKPMDTTNVQTLAEFDGLLFAGLEENDWSFAQGVWVSADGGQNWRQTGLDGRDVADLAIIDGWLFALSFDGLFISSDLGDNWFESEDLQDVAPRGVAQAGRKLYLTTYGSGIFISEDGGESWQPAGAPMDEGTVFNLVAVQGRLLADNGVDGVFYSDDGGQTWTQAPPPMDRQDVVVLYATDLGSLYAGTYGNGLFYSGDLGTTWTQAEPPLNDKFITAIVESGNRLLAGTEFSGIFRSADGGRTWFGSGGALLLRPELSGVYIDRDFNFMLAHGPQGVFRSEDGGFNWTTPDTFRNKPVSALIEFDGTIYAARDEAETRTGVDPAAVYRSDDGGRRWQRSLPLPKQPSRIRSLHASGAGQLGVRLYMSTSNNGVFYSSDRGTSWQHAQAPMDTGTVNQVISLADGRVLADNEDLGVFYSDDGGVTWTQANPPMNAQDVSVLRSSLLAVDLEIVYAGTFGDGVFYSDDGGVNWTQGGPPVSDFYILSLLVADNGTVFAGTFENGLWFSIDGGDTWQGANPPLDNKEIWSVFQLPGSDAYFAGTGNRQGIFRSLDGGLNWTALNTGVDFANQTTDFKYIPALQRLYAATDVGLYFQQLDFEPPVAEGLFIREGAAYSNQERVPLELYASDPATLFPDSMLIWEEGRFDTAKWQGYQEIINFTLSPGDGEKTIYAVFKDVSWNESEEIDASIILDKTRPNFTPFPHTPPTGVTRGRNIVVTQDVEEPNLDFMELWYRRVGEPWSRNRRSFFSGNRAEIDSVFITTRGLDYRIIATDLAGNTATLQNGPYDFYSLPMTLNAEFPVSSPNISGGTSGANYVIVSVPMSLGGAQPAGRVLGDLGKYGEEGDWRFYSFAGNNQWQEGAEVPVQTGGGYFIILRQGRSLKNGVEGTSTPTLAGVQGAIPGWVLRANDWTLIGNPYNTRIELSQLKRAKGDTSLSADATVQVWSYEGGWKNAKQENIALDPWRGLFVRSTQADTIIFASTSDPFARATGKAALAGADPLQALADGEWVVQVLAGSGEFHDTANYFGLRRGAQAALDDLDWYEPPLLPGAAGAGFRLGDGDAAVELAADFRPTGGDGQRWELVVRGAGGAAVQLHFVQLESVPGSYRLVLVDESTKIARDLRQEATLTLRIPDAGTKRLALLAGDEYFIRQHSDGLLGVPTAFALEQNYPNPFNPSTTIRYALPAAGRVTLEVFDLLGKRVLRLVDEETREAGYYETVADMAGLGSGMYFYRLSVDGEQRFQATKKMVYVK